jgi:hypothetical protein
MMITVGTPAVPGGNSGGPYTYVNIGNPSNASGRLKQVQIFVNNQMQGVVVATFSATGDTLTAKSKFPIGNLFQGLQICDVDLPVSQGDYIGIYFSSGDIAANFDGGPGLWRSAGDQTGCLNQPFIRYDGFSLSLYGTGEAEAEPEAPSPTAPTPLEREMLPMSPLDGPPLPKFLGIYWPWKK